MKDVLMKKKIYSTFNGRDEIISLPVLCRELLSEQKQAWKFLRDSYNTLERSVYRFLKKDGFSFQIQFNPGRIKSAAAKIDDESIAQRKCFLCLANLPSFQLGILYREDYIILCNPWPIFPGHLTIAHMEHLPQCIDNSFSVFLQMARDLSPDYTIFYNGPKCGASAPDHLHFQAVPSGSIPIEQDLSFNQNLRKIKDAKGTSLFKTMDTGRSVMIIEGKDLKNVERAFTYMMNAMRGYKETVEEPMINIVGSYQDGHWRVIIFPRRKFRPAVYYLKDEKQLLISPGAVEMSGFIVTPRKKDYEKIDMESIEGIFNEVSLEHEAFERIVGDMMGEGGLW